MKHLSLLALLVLTGCVEEALADPPISLSRPAEYSRVAAPIFGTEHTVPTGASIAGYVGSAGTVSAVADAMLFEFGSIIVVSCDLVATFCLTQDVEITMASSGLLTDPDSAPSGLDGRGSCFRVMPGAARDVTVWKSNFRDASRVGRRHGVCNNGNTTTVGAGCDEDTDCGTSGVCTTSRDPVTGQPASERIRGAYLNSRAPVQATCFVSIEA